jgi:hypothetical protein
MFVSLFGPQEKKGLVVALVSDFPPSTVKIYRKVPFILPAKKTVENSGALRRNRDYTYIVQRNLPAQLYDW